MSAEWFCKIGEKSVGPLTSQQMRTIVAKGQLRPEHMVRRGTEAPWVPAGKVKGLFPSPADASGEQPAAKAAKPGAGGKPTAKPLAKPAAPKTPAADLPEEMALGSGGGHKKHVAMNVDKLNIDAEPVMVANRKSKGRLGLKKEQHKKLTMIMMGAIGGGLLLVLIAFIIGWSRGALNTGKPAEEAKKNETAEPDPADKKPATVAIKTKTDSNVILYPKKLEVHDKKMEVGLGAPTREEPPEDSGISVDEGTKVLIIPVKYSVKLGKSDTFKYKAWDDETKKLVSLKDDTDTKLPLLGVIDEKDATVVGPGKPINIKLVFTAPVGKVKHVRLEMPGEPIGVSEMMTPFEIPGDTGDLNKVITKGKTTTPKKKITKPAEEEATEEEAAPPPVKKKKTTPKKKTPAVAPEETDEPEPARFGTGKAKTTKPKSKPAKEAPEEEGEDAIKIPPLPEEKP